MRIVAGICAVWALIEGWFQLQQVIFNRNTWTGAVQDWMSLAVAAMVIALFGYIFHQHRIAADERAEMRGEFTAARQVQHLLIPDKMLLRGRRHGQLGFSARSRSGRRLLSLPRSRQRMRSACCWAMSAAKASPPRLLRRCCSALPIAATIFDPPVVLKELNAALRNSGIEGFTTCLCADLTASGVLLIANAGQLAPYRNGQEIEIPVGLPLGVEAAASYAESSLQLAPGDSLTFLSDGVVEARNAVGELFGFERTRQLSSRAAQQIADAAVQFGQQDDITVLTLSLAPAPASA